MIGIHINKGDSKLEDALAQSFKDGWETGQVFLWVPQAVKQVEYDAKTVANYLKKEKKTIWIHSSYLINPWGKAPYNRPLSIKQLEEQAIISPNGGVIFHIPNIVPSSFIEDYKYLIDHKPKQSKILLENKAYVSSNTLAKPETFNLLVETFIKFKISKADIHFCIDTAHLFSAGISLTTENNAKAWLSKLKYPETIQLFHLNGNSSNSVRDIHEVPGSPPDLIWNKDDSGLLYILKWAKKHKIDCILECHYQRPDHKKYAKQFLSKINKK